MKKISYVIILLVVLAGGLAGFYYRDKIAGFYSTAVKSLSEVNNKNIKNVVSQVAKNILAPAPLSIGGQANAVVLSKDKVIAQTNIQRFDNGGLPPLIENAKLDAAARAKADDIFKNQYFEHISPSGVGPGQLAESFGYDYVLEGENLILGNFHSEQEMVQDWMNSPPHRANILNDRFVDIGVAVEKGTYKGQIAWVGVQEFGLPLSACPAPVGELKTEISNDTTQLSQMSTQINALKNQIDTTKQNSPNYNNLVSQYNALVDQYNQLNQTAKNIVEAYNNQVNNFNQCVEEK